MTIIAMEAKEGRSLSSTRGCAVKCLAWSGGSDPIDIREAVRHAPQQLVGGVADQPHLIHIILAP